MTLRLHHISLTARDAVRLGQFYEDVFGCSTRRAPARLTGPSVWRGNGLHGVDLTSIWLDWPGSDQPFLEILEYDTQAIPVNASVNAPGRGHFALEVDDLDATLERVRSTGGTLLGEVTTFGSTRLTYVADCEGNVIELECGV